MKFFVIGTCWMFLGIVMFRDLWMWTNIIDVRHHPEYAGGFHVIPQLAFGYVCLGIYYNLSVWYKLTNRTGAGAMITIIGAVITLVLNFWWIPLFSYVGSAWATMICYLAMMIVSFVWGQRVYPVPYEWKKLGGYLLIAVAFYLIQQWIATSIPNLALNTLLAFFMLLVFVIFTLINDQEEFARLPFVGKYLSTGKKG
jgi:O-antigen/teichoic acid export membrane protein